MCGEEENSLPSVSRAIPCVGFCCPTAFSILLLLFRLLLLRPCQECFAVRPDVDGMLDVARHTFLQSTDDIYRIADAMREEAGYNVKVRLESV